MTYQIQLTRSAERCLSDVPNYDQVRIAKKIDLLAENPRPAGVRKLSERGELYRIRVGDYRVIYEIHDKMLIVVVIRVAHRRNVYR
jgi:mRNA interferase RelE/StbE